MGRWMRGGLLLVAVLAAAGCSSALAVRGEVLQPARVPVRAFPRILVVATASPEAQRMADVMAEHLSGGRSQVQRVDDAALDGFRATGTIPRATVIVRVAVQLERRDRPEWSRREELDCGPLGCIENRRRFIEDVPVVAGRVVLTVADGPSGRTLQREELAEEESGADVLGMRLRVLERLSRQVRELVDQRTEPVVVELHPIEAPAVREALELIRSGAWAEGRRRLERFVESDAFDALAIEQRALVLYDLGQSRRFDTSIAADARFDAAADALRAAVRLVPAPRYAQALGQLEAHRHSRAMVREQQEAMAHNFRLAQQPPTEVAAPPPGYRR